MHLTNKQTELDILLMKQELMTLMFGFSENVGVDFLQRCL